MKFKSTIWGYMKLGFVFTVFMFVIAMLIMLIFLPLMLIPLGIGLIMGPSVGGTDITMPLSVGVLTSIILLIVSFVVVGWAVFFFVRENTFVYNRKGLK